jgi:hypothetical protein
VQTLGEVKELTALSLKDDPLTLHIDQTLIFPYGECLKLPSILRSIYEDFRE